MRRRSRWGKSNAYLLVGMNGDDYVLVVRNTAPPQASSNVTYPKVGVVMQTSNERFIKSDGGFW